MTLAGATDTDVFRTYVGKVLCPTLRKGDIVVMDNLGAHKSPATLALIKAAGAQARFLPAYSPDGMPYIGRTARWRNAILATGHAMMGLSLGPVTGKIVSAIIDGEAPAFDLAMLAPDQFA